uniref:Uncharacterized protein n=1 Tax=Phytophthora fragariae TaxID=53985 RepID=A0A6A3E648_9STRA|nr:hypothetical protein PF009_g20822 [Phytophthora fragariae]
MLCPALFRRRLLLISTNCSPSSLHASSLVAAGRRLRLPAGPVTGRAVAVAVPATAPVSASSSSRSTSPS